jgi:hypothetical protein
MNYLLQPTCRNQACRVHIAEVPDAKTINAMLYKHFLMSRNRADTRRSHFFKGRYENIYIATEHVPEIGIVLEHIMHWIMAQSGQHDTALKQGFWLNFMLPGEQTLAHTHDDDQELWSAVYYVRVPPDSGQLVLGSDPESLIVTPEEGLVVMFPPDLVHKVTTNYSNEPRLSIGINIGR